MFVFRSAIRRLFGISIPGVDSTKVNGRSYYSDADVIAELRSALAEAEQEIILLKYDRELDAAVIAELRAALDEAEREIIMLKFYHNFEVLIADVRKAQLLSALGTVMEAYGISGTELVEDEDEELDDDEIF